MSKNPPKVTDEQIDWFLARKSEGLSLKAMLRLRVYGWHRLRALAAAAEERQPAMSEGYSAPLNTAIVRPTP